MKTKSTVLTKEERDFLILAGLWINGTHLSNNEIAQRVGISVTRVKRRIRQACVKLEAHTRSEAIFFAAIRGEISLNELYPLDKLVEVFSPLGIDMLRRIAYLMGEELENEHLPVKDEQIIRTDRRQDTILTKGERDVLILAGRGLTNRDIADRLCISISTVRTFLNRACTKLGARKSIDTLVLALKRGEINIGEIF